MLKRSISLPAVALAFALSPAALGAQAAAPDTPASWTVSGAFGGLSGAANLDPAGTADWRLGWAAGIDLTRSLDSYVAIRASGGWTQDSLRGASLVGRGKFNKFTYDADLVLRYPTAPASATLIPYVLGGGGPPTPPSPRPATPLAKFPAKFPP